MASYPKVRLRRLRQSENTRKMFGDSKPAPDKFIWPVFVVDGTRQQVPIKSLPGQFRYSVDMLQEALESISRVGIGGVMLFGVVDNPSNKSFEGSYAYDDEGTVQRAVKMIRANFPQLLVCTDVCLCGYTTHGHCGAIGRDGLIKNDETIETLAKIALSHAAAGANCVSPSAMMDGQVHAIREALDETYLEDTLIMSYSTKFASSMYGPFREASDCSASFGDRKTYQLPYSCYRQAIRESIFDEKEGADILMVKPSLFYLDIISKLTKETQLPIAAFNVSGEYSMLHTSSAAGYGDLKEMARESLACIFRAGSDVVISYWANQYNDLYK
ncbi:MAG: porphobilinogen synthase [bacterium]|nr:porphobilinogen synthase [bacterium]